MPETATGTREITFAEAIREALAEEMRRDSRVFIMGEDVAEAGTPFKVLSGLVEEFGTSRVVDTPISEAGFTGVGVGAAMTGLRPVVELIGKAAQPMRPAPFARRGAGDLLEDPVEMKGADPCRGGELGEARNGVAVLQQGARPLDRRDMPGSRGAVSRPATFAGPQPGGLRLSRRLKEHRVFAQRQP